MNADLSNGLRGTGSLLSTSVMQEVQVSLQRTCMFVAQIMWN
jgi:hypothetical protein